MLKKPFSASTTSAAADAKPIVFSKNKDSQLLTELFSELIVPINQLLSWGRKHRSPHGKNVANMLAMVLKKGSDKLFSEKDFIDSEKTQRTIEAEKKSQLSEKQVAQAKEILLAINKKISEKTRLFANEGEQFEKAILSFSQTLVAASLEMTGSEFQESKENLIKSFISFFEDVKNEGEVEVKAEELKVAFVVN